MKQLAILFPVHAQRDLLTLVRCALLVVALVGLVTFVGCGRGGASSAKRQATRLISEDDQEAPANNPATKNSAKKEADEDDQSFSLPLKTGKDTASVATDRSALTRGKEASKTSGTASISEDSDPAVVQSSRTTEKPAKEDKGGDNSEWLTNSASEQPLTPQQVFQQRVRSMQTLSDAIRRYYEDHGCFPPAVISVAGRKLLSWRVALLPYLGEEELYKEFALDQPWNSVRNRKILERMPRVYEGLGCAPYHTPYVAIVGDAYGFRELHGRTHDEFTDGLENTVVVMEVHESLAVPWTEPRDFRPGVSLDLSETFPSQGTLVLWGDGGVGYLSTKTPVGVFRGLLTLDAGEPVFAADVQRSYEDVLKELAGAK